MRRRLCSREVALNSRLSPDTYLGVVEIHEQDGRLAIDGPGPGRRGGGQDAAAARSADAQPRAGPGRGHAASCSGDRAHPGRVPRQRLHQPRAAGAQGARRRALQLRRELPADRAVHRHAALRRDVQLHPHLHRAVPGPQGAAARPPPGRGAHRRRARRRAPRLDLRHRPGAHLRLHRVQRALPHPRRGRGGGVPGHGPGVRRPPRPRRDLRGRVRGRLRRPGAARPPRLLQGLPCLRAGQDPLLPDRRPAHPRGAQGRPRRHRQPVLRAGGPLRRRVQPPGAARSPAA